MGREVWDPRQFPSPRLGNWWDKYDIPWTKKWERKSGLEGGE